MSKGAKTFFLLGLALSILLLGEKWLSSQTDTHHKPIKAHATHATKPAAATASPVGSTQEPKRAPTLAPPSSGSALSQAQREFRELVREVYQSLPDVASLQKLSDEEVHDTPIIIRKAGRQLGRVAEALDKDQSLATEAVKFYAVCALTEKFPDSVRALCYHHHESLSKKLTSQGLASSSLLNHAGVSRAVRALATNLSGN